METREGPLVRRGWIPLARPGSRAEWLRRASGLFLWVAVIGGDDDERCCRIAS